MGTPTVVPSMPPVRLPLFEDHRLHHERQAEGGDGQVEASGAQGGEGDGQSDRDGGNHADQARQPEGRPWSATIRAATHAPKPASAHWQSESCPP